MKRGGGNPYVNQPQRKEGDKGKAETGATPPPTHPSSSLPTPEMEARNLVEIEASGSSQPSEPPSSPPLNRRGKGVDRKPAMPQIVPTDDMINISKTVAAMKQNVDDLTKAMEAMQRQAVALTAVNGSMKLEQEVKSVRDTLGEQIKRQQSEIKVKRRDLEIRMAESLRDDIQEKLRSHIQTVVRRQVAERVAEELSKRVPADLRGQSMQHDACMCKIDVDLHNYDARRRNANVKPMDPLLKIRIPKARAASISRSSSSGSAAYPTPRTTSTLLRTPSGSSTHFPIIHDESYVVSPDFPDTLQVLYENVGKDRNIIKTLLQDHEGNALGLDLNDDAQMRKGVDRVLHIIGAQTSRYNQVLLPPPVKQKGAASSRPANARPDNNALLSPLNVSQEVEM